MRVTLLSLVFVLCLTLINAAVEHVSVIRNVDITSQVVRESIVLQLQSTDGPVSEYVVLVDENLAFFEANDKSKNQAFTWAADKKSITVKLDKPITEEKKQLNLKLVYTHSLHPLPKEIGQNDKQKMVYEGNLVFKSPYPAAKTKTVITASNEIISFTKYESLTSSGNKITYGPVTNVVQPNTEFPIRVHYVNNSPFLNVERHLRVLEVSHWGNNLNYQENYDTIHAGALLKGQYSRLDFDRYRMNRENTGVIESVTFNLPKEARDVYFGDIIGNISTSHFRTESSKSVLELYPRFPLFGGWKTKWTHGFNVDLSSQLSILSNGEYSLRFDFVTPFQNAVIDDYTLKVILPEGATNIKFVSEVDLEIEQSFENIQTYLDTYGRPIFVAKRKNVVNEHSVPVQIVYTYSTTSMLQEPLLLIGFYFVLFLFSMAVLRVNFSISSNNGSEKTKYIKNTFETNEEEKKSLFNSLNKELENYKEHKNAEKFKQVRNNINNTIESIEKDNKQLYEELKVLSHSTYNKVHEIAHATRKRIEESSKVQDEIISLISKGKGKDQTDKHYSELEKIEKEYNSKVKEALIHDWD